MKKRQYKRLLEKVLFDDDYRDVLSGIVSESALSLEDSVHWLDQSIALGNFTDIKGNEYLKFIVDLANKGFDRVTISEMVTECFFKN